MGPLEALARGARIGRSSATTCSTAFPDTIFFVKDAPGRYVAANRMLAERTGLERKETLIGLTADQVFPGELGRRIAEQDRAILKSARSLKGELELHLYPGRRWRVVPDLEGAAVRPRGRSSVSSACRETCAPPTPRRRRRRRCRPRCASRRRIRSRR